MSLSVTLNKTLVSYIQLTVAGTTDLLNLLLDEQITSS